MKGILFPITDWDKPLTAADLRYLGFRTAGLNTSAGQIYQFVEPRKPSGNNWWREKVRQTLQRHCVSVDRGVWQLEAA